MVQPQAGVVQPQAGGRLKWNSEIGNASAPGWSRSSLRLEWSSLRLGWSSLGLEWSSHRIIPKNITNAEYKDDQEIILAYSDPSLE